MANQFGDKEREVLGLFQSTKTVKFNGEHCEIILSDKPTISKGECKTDVYVLLRNKDGVEHELKISVKLDNADFLENKMRYDRAVEIFGSNTDLILSNSIAQIKNLFEAEELIYFQKKSRTRKYCITLGWKFELLNKQGGGKSGRLILTDDEKIDIYAGTNLPDSKKHAVVNGKTIKNSGVANYIIELNRSHSYSINDVIDNLVEIEEYVINKEVYFACKALNYRVDEGKWDGNRPLAVWVEYFIENDLLKAKLCMDKPLTKYGNEIGDLAKACLSKLDIDSSNFDDLKNYCSNIKTFG